MHAMRYLCAFLVAFFMLAPGRPAAAQGQPTEDRRLLLRHIDQLHRAGKYREAVEPAERYVAAVRAQHGENHADYANALISLAHSYRGLGRFGDAEPIYKRALAILERTQGPDARSVSLVLSNLAVFYLEQARFGEAEPLLMRALAIREKRSGPDHPDVAIVLNNLGELYRRQRRYAEAEAHYKRSLEIREKRLGPHSELVGKTLNNLAFLYMQRGLAAEAEPLRRRQLAIVAGTLGPDHHEMAVAVGNLGTLLANTGRYEEAEPLLKRALAILEKSFGSDHPDVATAHDVLAHFHFAQQQWALAAGAWQQSTQVTVRRATRSADDLGRAQVGSATGETGLAGARFLGLVKAVYRLAEAEPARASDMAQETFRMAQWARASDAAGSLAQMGTRHAKGDGALARLVRERQDLAMEWQGRDKALMAARTEPPARRSAQAEADLASRLGAIDVRIAEIDRTLAERFPDYAVLSGPAPLSIGEVQALLSADEALLLFLDTSERKPTPEETFIWIVTRTDTRWVRVHLGTQALAGRVGALRCGLDRSAWDGDGQSRCGRLLRVGPEKMPNGGAPLPFSLTVAHELYQALFGQIEDLVKGKHLFVVPSGPLTQLPFHALVTKPVAAVGQQALQGAEWLARRHAISILPAVSSLRALRGYARASQASSPYIGFGNPLLLGPEGKDRKAWEQSTCDQADPVRDQTASRSVRAAIPRFFRSGLANVEVVRVQYPLPETASELCAVARSIGSPHSDVHLGERATEKAIKALSMQGALAHYRVVHFATHGLIAGETALLAASKAEPALILTPPSTASEEDDGLLTASEITGLKFDADWVILSACNTAAGGAQGAEALSGLARAFFYAGARALLVSHWAVYSDSTVKLITKAFDQIKLDGGTGRAETLRQAMLALIDRGEPDEAHPAYWAPFVVVGEGAR